MPIRPGVTIQLRDIEARKPEARAEESKRWNPDMARTLGRFRPGLRVGPNLGGSTCLAD